MATAVSAAPAVAAPAAAAAAVAEEEVATAADPLVEATEEGGMIAARTEGWAKRPVSRNQEA